MAGRTGKSMCIDYLQDTVYKVEIVMKVKMKVKRRFRRNKSLDTAGGQGLL